MVKFEDLPETTVEVEGITRPKPASNFLQDYYKTLGDGTKNFIGLETGFSRLDKLTLGLDGVTVLGGIPGAGKTAFASQLAFEVCRKGTPVLFYSLEMSRQDILTRTLSRLCVSQGVTYNDIILKGREILKTGDENSDQKNFTGGKAKALVEARKQLEEVGKGFYIRTRDAIEAEITLEAVKAEINLIKADYKARTDKVFVVIDHLQMFPIESKNYNDQIDKENKLITGFMDIKNQTGAVILLISQKNKAGFASAGIQTIKGSVDIVYDADRVMLLETEEEKNQPGAGVYELANSFSGSIQTKIDLNIIKGRRHGRGKVNFLFNGEYYHFEETEER